MKVKCIDYTVCFITVGKIYEVTNESVCIYTIINDEGMESAYFKTSFEIVEDEPQPDNHIILNVLRGGGSHLSKKEKLNIYSQAADLIEKLMWEK